MFGLSGMAQPLRGGEGRSFQVGDHVLKPCSCPEEAIWLAETMPGIRREGFRIADPLRANNGQWVVDGWTAWSRIEGSDDKKDARALLKAGRAFCRACSHLERPAWLDQRENPWAMADKMVWGEREVRQNPLVRVPFERLQVLLKPVTPRNHMVHCDLAGNTLFAPDMDPGIIDLTMYWRPLEYALAIAAADLIDWYGATREDILAELGDLPDLFQFLARAEMFRIAVWGAFPMPDEALEKKLVSHRGSVDWICSELS
jgi:uncharacterized protein (TIGR02569 family)